MVRMWTVVVSALLAALMAPAGDAFVVRTPALIAAVGRGGATVSVEDETLLTTEEVEEDEEVEEEEGEEGEEGEESEDESAAEDEEEEIVNTAKLAAATVSATAKTKSKVEATKKASIKTEVNKKLTSSKKKKNSLMKLLHIPYIVKASLNPFTFFAMTKAYWASLFNLDYLKKADASQDLRSALEEKAKKGGTAHNKGRRKMKRGQAKTLSDLPQLNT
ncbi:hypothetical protein FisN_9Lh255 [Fistulifera solaris]|uniref:Uncharacterized protein n=1 Tax=Fistulifera solaris TaxID=1519565 RepID=A0A1Z5KLP7_FISSO|nr:hypothetical protein FisN_9Lh255 [Fistulifera solaris]|eukprot:GAX26951.1 hypothetical protein FisN_9Lh255 [Fistulifera solaris]